MSVKLLENDIGWSNGGGGEEEEREGHNHIHCTRKRLFIMNK